MMKERERENTRKKEREGGRDAVEAKRSRHLKVWESNPFELVIRVLFKMPKRMRGRA